MVEQKFREGNPPLPEGYWIPKEVRESGFARKGEPALVRWPDKWKEGRVAAVGRDGTIVVQFDNGGILDVGLGAYALKELPSGSSSDS